MTDISIIIPTRNRPVELRRALESVRMQKGTLSLECIVVDDGDENRAGEVRKLAGTYEARCFSTGGGRGGGYARNIGIDESDGCCVAFLDDDDAWMEDKLSRQYEAMRDGTIGMSYTGMWIVGPGGGRRYSFRKPGSDDHYRAIMRKNFIGTTSTVMVRKSALETVGGFDPALPQLQDYDLYLRLLKRFRCGWLPEPLTLYYDRDTGDKVSADRERFLAAVRLLAEKYRKDEYFPLLRAGFRSILLLKCIRSRRFLFATLRSLFPGGR